ATHPLRGRFQREIAPRLRSFAAERLPEYMLPGAFVLLEALPLSPNGKVDRAALPDTEARSVSAGSAYLAPRGPVEEALVEIWSAVLGLSRVGVEDSFFELGGHSLLATQLVSRVRETFGVELPVRAVFEAPTVARLAQRLESPGETALAPPIGRLPRHGDLPLSFAQERLWFIDQLEPGGSAYNLPAAVRLTGQLDRPALAGALTEVVRRHESLRTTFEEVSGTPRQVIAVGEAGALPSVDLTALTAPERGREERRLRIAEARRPFDLRRGPLLRATLVLLGELEQTLLLTLHHIVSDAWSISLLIGEVSAFYGAIRQARPSPLRPLAIQYPDYAGWQRAWLSGPVLAAQVAWWRGQLAGMPQVLELPADRPRPPLPTGGGAIVRSELPADAVEALQALARRRGATLFMSLLALFQALLARHSGQEDFGIGTPIAGRDRVETEPLIGLFVNHLVVRAELSGCPGLAELLERLRDRVLSAYAHQHLPFEKLVEELAPERDLSRAPLVQASLNLLNALRIDRQEEQGATRGGEARAESRPGGRSGRPGLPATPLLPGLELEIAELAEPIARLDLALHAEVGAGLRLRWVYSTDLFDAVRIVRMAGQLDRLLRSCLADPEAPVAELPLASAAERQQMLVEWNDTAEPWQADCLHELFEAQADRCPEAPALVSADGQEVSYGELERLANRLAHRLRAAGVGPEVRVALCVDRSIAMVAAVLAVLKAGGAYVPLDPELPLARLALLLDDSAAALLLASGRQLDRFAGFRGPVLVAEECLAGAGPEWRPERSAAPENLAYLVYTSGSTGRPKGVLGTHRGAASYLRFLLAAYGVGPVDRVLQLPALTFDASVRDLIGPLAAGAAVVLVDAEQAKNPAALLAVMARWRITRLLSVVPTMLRGWIEAAPEEASLDGLGRPGTVRSLLVSGERLYLADAVGARERFGPELEIVNQYGPTECTMTSSYHRVARMADGRGEAPLGRPIARSRFHLLRQGITVPLGSYGELHIGGEGLARGYLGRPDLTAAAFRPDPFSAVPGARLYATGDLVRHRPDGNLELLGRRDHQVKLRGFRVELGEVEAALAGCLGVLAAAVTVREDANGGRVLVAHVVVHVQAESGAEPDAERLRRELALTLPAYMVPSAFRFLERLPLTPHGKVDRQALARAAAEASSERRYTPPRTALEGLLAAIFSEVLNTERVGVDDSFFELGGHSLLATRLASRIRAACGVELPVRAVFEAPTVAGLAALLAPAVPALPAVAALAGSPGGPALRPVSWIERSGPLPLSFAQQRFWFLYQMDPESPVYNVPTFVRLRGALRRGALAAALRQVAHRHEVIRTTFAVVDGEPVQRIGQAETDLPVVDLTDLPLPVVEEESRRLVALESRRPFDLGSGPLLRAMLVVHGETHGGAHGEAHGEEDHLLLLTMHHIASDAWSMGVLVRELAALYRAAVEGLPSPLAPLKIQYADFAAWQRQWLSGPAFAAELDYWRARLVGVPVLDLPTDRSRPSVQTFAGARLPLALPAELSAAILALSRGRGATLFMALLAAFQTLLGRYTGLSEASVGSPISGRNRLETEELVGCFINTLVVRTDLADDPPFADLLARVRELSLAAFAHQDLPFERIVQELLPERDPSRSPLFQILFAWQNAPLERIELPGDLRLEPVPAADDTAKLDLTLSMAESPGGLRGFLEYNRDLFDRATVARLSGHLETLLAAVVERPETRLSALPLLTAGERQQLLAEWNDTRAPHPLETPIHELFERQAARTPELSAVIFAGERLTYRELDRCSNQLARRLRRLGVGPEERVAICLARGLDLAVALLGVLKAGGAYVPLDPDYPQERLAFMLADSGASVLVTEEGLRAALPAAGLRVVSVDAERLALAAESAAPVASGTSAENLAYVIYTSGSTATPKGVLVPHRAFVNHNAASAAYYEVAPGDRFLQFASISFDVAGEEFFIPWLAGATVALHADPAGTSFEQYLELVAGQELSILNLPASFWHDWVAELSRAPRPLPPSLRVMIVGNEKALPERFAAWRRLIGERVRSTNAYGPTEDTVTSTIYESALAPESEVLRTVPIGRPLANKQVHVLDAEMRPVPVGVPGELYIGGAGLARGYLGRPDLTVEKFVPNPFGELRGTPGSRLYRTGDLARQRPDGNVEFLGRVDHQVKIRGFRIELGEIETVLGQYPGVGSVVVLAREDRPGEVRLVAYVVGEGGALQAPPATPAALRRYVRERLPEYMVPAACVVLAAWPMTPNGKLDRKALPAPETVESAAETAHVAPRTPVEELVAGVWAEILGLARVGAEDNFFELGGHSLLATRVVSRLREALPVDLPLRDLFELPTVAALAARLERALGAGAPGPAG
ncbi:MAG TPA: amino acid adenylation domain-containing protein, partial [Thermoanaerobaculia bacterium]|nr:amino acid adenylation domain-containing protein [Thermoanaerobaculia bacterium]